MTPTYRDITHIAPVYVPADGDSFIIEYATCYDGTAWKRIVQVKGSHTTEWVQIPGVPAGGLL